MKRLSNYEEQPEYDDDVYQDMRQSARELAARELSRVPCMRCKQDYPANMLDEAGVCPFCDEDV